MKRVLFAVLGDLAKHCWALLAPHVAHVLPLLLEHFNPNYVSACNNAVWATGEIITQMGAAKMENEAFHSQAVARLAPLCLPYDPRDRHRGRIHRSVVETSAVCLGRIAVRDDNITTCTQSSPLSLLLSDLDGVAERSEMNCGVQEVSPASVVAYPQLDSLFEGWCNALRNSRDGDDKEHATMGLVAALQVRSSPRVASSVEKGATKCTRHRFRHVKPVWSHSHASPRPCP